jgi:hypothetical protein
MIVLFLLLSVTAVAQTKSVDVDNFRFTYACRAFPAKPVQPMLFPYAVRVNTTKMAERRYLSAEEVEDALLIEGQEKIYNPDDALMRVELMVGSIIIVNTDVKERKTTHKDKKGEVHEEFFYTPVIDYSFEASGAIHSKDGKVRLTQAYFNPRSVLHFSGEEYKSRKAATDFWRNNREALTAEFYRRHTFEAAAKLSAWASATFGFPIVNSSDILKTMDEKKHVENNAFRAACNALKDELQYMTPEIPLDRDRVDGIIDYFESIPERYPDRNSKADIRIRYAAYYNLCKIFLYLDEPDNVARYADPIRANGYDPKDCERLKKEATTLKATFDRMGIRTRHFNPSDF